ncbi:MAG: sugar transporter substrate-binding protein [Cohnella sp.]|nr:sugar transporter substrate-binding protein [Cohnella sp.]
MRKTLSFVLALVLVLTTLAGCSNGSGTSNKASDSGNSATTTTTTATAAKSGETTEIVFWQLDGPTWLPLYKDLIKKFEDSHPDIKVKMTNIPEEGYFEKLNTAFAAGKGPDMWGGWYSPDEFDRGYIANIDPFIQKDGLDMNKYFQPITGLRLKGKDGHYYGLPRDMSNAVILYNKDLFDKYKVPYPVEGWTLDDFRNMAKQLTHKENKVYGTDLFTSDLNGISGNPILWNMGGDVTSDDGWTIKGYLDSPTTIKLFEYAQSVAKDGSDVPTSIIDSMGDAGPFASGNVGMTIGWLWGYNTIKKAGFKTGAVPFPKPQGSTSNYSWSETVSWYMNAKSKHQDAVWQFMKFMSGEDIGKDVVKDFTWGPPMPKIWEDNGLDKDEVLKVFLDQAKLDTKAPHYDRNRSWYDVSNLFVQAYTDIVNPVDGRSYKDPKTVLPKVADEMQKKLDELKAQNNK